MFKTITGFYATFLKLLQKLLCNCLKCIPRLSRLTINNSSLTRKHLSINKLKHCHVTNVFVGMDCTERHSIKNISKLYIILGEIEFEFGGSKKLIVLAI